MRLALASLSSLMSPWLETSHRPTTACEPGRRPSAMVPARSSCRPAAVGWVMFGDFPDAMSWVGIAVIAASGIIIAWREARLARRERRAMGGSAEKQVP